MNFIYFAIYVRLMFKFVFLEFDFDDYNFSIYYTIVLWLLFSGYKIYVRKFLIRLESLLPNKPEDKVLLINKGNNIYINKTEKSNGEFTYVNVGDILYFSPDSYFKFTVKEKHLRNDNFINIETYKRTRLYGSKRSHFVFGKHFLNITTKLLKYGFYIYFSLMILHVTLDLYNVTPRSEKFYFGWNSNYNNYSEQIKYPQYTDPVTNKVYNHKDIDIICHDNKFDGLENKYFPKLDDVIDCSNDALYSKVEGSVFGEGFYKGGVNINEGLYYYVSSERKFIQFNEDDTFDISNSANLIDLKSNDIINVESGSLLIEKDKFEPNSFWGTYPAADYIVGENLEPGTYKLEAYNYILNKPLGICSDERFSSYTLVNKQEFFQIFNGKVEEFKYSVDIGQCSSVTIELKDGDYLMLEDTYLRKIGK